MSERFLAVALALAVMLGAATPATAQAPQATSLTITLLRPTKPELPRQVAVKVTGKGGASVAGVPVTVYAVVDVIGPRAARLGRAVTDATGVASVPFRPTRQEYTIKAVFAGDAEHAAGTRTTALVVPPEDILVVHDHDGARTPLADVRQVMPRAIAALVALYWVALISGVVAVVRSIRRRGAAAAAAEPVPV